MKQLVLGALLIFQYAQTEVLSEILNNKQKCTPLFPSENNITETIINLINEEQKSIKLAIYFLTDWAIGQALVNAHIRGIKVTIITDHSSAKDTQFSKIKKLAKEDINVYSYESTKDGIMHNKFMILKQNYQNKTILLTGSFNFTHSAQSKNMENVIIIRDSKVAKIYSNYFKKLKKECTKIKSTKRKRNAQ